jgi:glycosyltransferase involved in cell wall biosynthesis
MHVLILCSYPKEAAATRFRVGQFVGPLRGRGIEVTVSPFLDGGQFARMYESGGKVRRAAGLVPPFFRRLGEVLSSRQYDLLFVQREAMFFGPAVFEWLTQTVGRIPMVLDLDDATYVPYTSPSYGQLGSALKFFGKTDRLIERATVVTCGNRFIAKYAQSKGTRTVIIPTVADTDLFSPADKRNDPPVIGWIGTHSTFPSVESIFPVLQRLAEKHQFTLKLVGTGREQVEIAGVKVENLPWSLEREAEDFRSIEIGLYPIVTSASANEQWLKGKSGFKAIQYMAVGIPFVMSPVGVCSEIGVNGETHLNAESPEDWYNALDSLLSNPDLRQKMGERARSHSLKTYTVEKWSSVLADVLLSAVGDRDKDN